MKRKIAFLFVLFVIAAVAAQQPALNITQLINNTVEGGGAIKSGSNFYETGLLKDWQAICLILSMITVLLVGLARMLAEPFNLPELKAWANMEWSQVFVTVIIVVFLIACVAFIDSIVLVEVNGSSGSPVQCEPTEFCLAKVANVYVDGLIDLAKAGGREAFTKSLKAGGTASARMTFSCGTLLFLPCLWGYTGWANNAFLILDVERYNQEIEQYHSLIYSLSVQKFFVNNVAYLVGPALLIIGVVARSFFITRRAGGLMMATAIGLMVVFPMMYLWNMITLNVTIFGDKLFNLADADCPTACGIMPAIARIGERPANATDLEGLSIDDYEGIKNGSIASVGSITSCEAEALAINASHSGANSPKRQYYCPDSCRVLPYPYYTVGCEEPKVQLACNEMKKACKAVRKINETEANAVCSASGAGADCPDDCKIVPPLNNGEGCGACYNTANANKPLAAPFNCRVALARNKTTGLTMDDRPDICLMPQGQNNQGTYPNPIIDLVKNCPPSTDADQSCMYVVPDIADCECIGSGGCGIYVPGVSDVREHEGTSTDANGNVNSFMLYDCYSYPNNCLNYTGAKWWNKPNKPCTCFGSNCTSPSKHCESCLNISNDYCMFKPPVVPDCPDECQGGTMLKPALLTPAEFVKKSGNGMFGREDIKNVSKMLLPAYLLPLINIVVTLMFIRGFSPLLGGDIDLPGYAKVL